MRKSYLAPLFMIFFSCSSPERQNTIPISFYESKLFHDVQLKEIFPDSKTFVDCIPKKEISAIINEYNKIYDEPDFDLREFVSANFSLPVRPQSTFATDTTLSMEEHLTKLWPLLTRTADEVEPRSSLIPLPYNYVVPGGRFSEIYYWDSYFTILGLKSQKRYDLIQSMVRNFAHLIDAIGFIPNGNRNYYLTRSQPPFFSLIVNELQDYDSLAAQHYLRSMLKEYQFWMHGKDSLSKPGDAFQHVVLMEDGTVMNRYYDKGITPRPEAYKEDYHLAQKVGGDTVKLYRDIRAAAESGWDFSSRWFKDGKSMETIHTTDIIPVDLNCLLAHLEKMIAQGYLQSGEQTKADEFNTLARKRIEGILKYHWDAEANFFMDYDFVVSQRTGVKSLAGMFPIFFEMADEGQAKQVSVVLKNEFLQQGGLVTTLVDTDQQWDAPNGWAPLQWIAYRGMKNYELNAVASEIRQRWLRQNMRVYEATGKMMEKYNVMDTTLIGGGGEYPNQDGFGWTNGVALTFLNENHLNLESK